jgi:mannonate dehydratase
VKWTLRWFGPHDPVPLAHLRQVPGLDGVVTALTDVPAGTPWTRAQVAAHAARLAEHGLRWRVVESIPVSEAIKTGGPERDDHVAAWAESLRTIAEAGVTTVCYNFMPVLDWMRTDFAMPLGDGSNAMAYDEATLQRIDLTAGLPRLEAWAHGYTPAELRAALERYADIDEARLLEHLTAFLRDVVPVAEALGVRLAIHPDDPPWSIFGLPRIVSDAAGIQRVLDAVDSPANALTFCTGALGVRADNDLVAMATAFAPRIAFVHARNVRRTGPRDFHETAHLRGAGDVDLGGVLAALVDAGVDVPLRPDHGRMIWGETAIPGYGLFDRAIGLAYLQGLAEAFERRREAAATPPFPTAEV